MIKRANTDRKTQRNSQFTNPEEKTTLKDWGIDDNDVSYILLAQRVEKLCSYWKHNRPRKGFENEKQVYNRFEKF